jgi:hypothetical protein
MDDTDMAQARDMEDTARAIRAARREIPPGVEGECYKCEEYSLRLIGGATAPVSSINEFRSQMLKCLPSNSFLRATVAASC